MNLSEQLDWLEASARSWIRSDRNVHRPAASALTPAKRALYESFFSATTLDRARFADVPIVTDPPFLAQAVAFGLRPIAFAAMEGITFDDTVLLSQARRAADDLSFLRLLFHELVHVAQYEILGVDEFARQYVQGYAANGFVYERIPLEAAAYKLGGKFLAAPRVRFSVIGELGY